MVNLILARASKQLFQVNRTARVEAFAVLNKIKCQTLIKIDTSTAQFLEVCKNCALALQVLEGLFNSVPTLGRTLSLLALIVITCDFDKHICRSMSGNTSNLIDNTNCLVKASADGWRAWQLVNTQVSALNRIVLSIALFNTFFKPKCLIVKHFHKNHGLALATGCIGITLTKYVHNAHAITSLRCHFDARKELPRQTTPARKALLADSLNLGSIQHAVTRRPKLILKLFFKNPSILKKRVPKNDLLNHFKVRRRKLLNPEDIFYKEAVRIHLGLKTTLSLTSVHLGHLRHIALAHKPLSNVFI